MEIVTSSFSTIAPHWVKSIGRQARYIFHFKSIIENLNEEAKNLRLRQEHMQHRVDEAIKQTEVIEKDVESWLRDASNVVADFEDLEKETTSGKEKCLYGWCPNLIWKYKLARRAEKKTNIMLKLRDSGKFDNVSYPTPLPGINVLPPKEFMPFESTKYTFNLIFEALKDDQTNVVGLYGTGGVGKTTLAKAVVNKTKEENIFNEVVMVVVTQTPNIKDIQDQIADFLDLEFDKKSTEGRAERLYMRLKNEKKILIILDDIWEKLDLKMIGIPVDDHHKDCKIFLTSRRKQVCIDMGCQSRIPLDVLNEEEGFVLFKRHVGFIDDSPTMINLAKEVAKECKGLPLAIVAIGSALKGKGIDEWMTLTQNLKKSKLMDADIVDANVYACLKLSYDYLKNEKTKLCFLLCALFPEDHEIKMEKLVRYGMGLGLYQYTDSIEEARTELRVMINNLKASSLLLDANEGCVKMHDVVRDVALWITSKGEDLFMVKAGIGLTEWPKHEGLEQYTSISLMKSYIEVLPDGLVCPKLKILLLDGCVSNVSDDFFEELKALKVLRLKYFNLSLNSLQPLMNLVTLQLIRCELRDMFSLKKLTKLEILDLHGSEFVELPGELRELSKLRMLDIRDCSKLKWIPVNVISRLSRLEELYIGNNSFKGWEVEGTSAERSNASLSELSKLHHLTILSFCVKVQRRVPKDFVLPTKLLRYDIAVNSQNYSSYPESRWLRIWKIEAASLSLFAFKAFYAKAYCLELGSIIDMTQQHVPSTAFSNLVNLSLRSVGLREICSGVRPPRGFLDNLEILNIDSCNRMSCLFPTMLIQRLRKLKKVSVEWCVGLQDVFAVEGLCYTKENPFLLSSLACLELKDLPNMRKIWKGPTQQVSLQSLTFVQVYGCHELRYVFTLTLARSLLQLEVLRVSNCASLEHIVEINAEENVTAGCGNDVVLPKLRIVQLSGLENLINFCSENYCSTWPALQELEIDSTFFAAQLEANVQQLRVLRVERSDQLSTAVVAQLRNGFQNLEELRICYCGGVQVIFQLEGLEQELSLPSLKVLELKYLDELECLWKGPTHLLNLQNLKKLIVTGCNRLRHMFSPTLAGNLLHLEQLIIEYCGELEQIIVGDHTEDHVQLGLFPNLSSIYVRKCDKLKTLFPVSIARSGLQKLTSLEVEETFQLEELFGHEDEADTVGDREIVMSRLEKLILVHLVSLINFCPSGYHFIFQSLSELVVTECPKITTKFSVDQNRSVHAEVEAPQTGKEHVDMEESPPDVTREINCWSSKRIQEILPPYIEK
ncbi:hypothetical protein ACOSQ4_031163 [Xanthoceras sorbifolium]